MPSRAGSGPASVAGEETSTALPVWSEKVGFTGVLNVFDWTGMDRSNWEPAIRSCVGETVIGILERSYGGVFLSCDLEGAPGAALTGKIAEVFGAFRKERPMYFSEEAFAAQSLEFISFLRALREALPGERARRTRAGQASFIMSDAPAGLPVPPYGYPPGMPPGGFPPLFTPGDRGGMGTATVVHSTAKETEAVRRLKIYNESRKSLEEQMGGKIDRGAMAAEEVVVNFFDSFGGYEGCSHPNMPEQDLEGFYYERDMVVKVNHSGKGKSKRVPRVGAVAPRGHQLVVLVGSAIAQAGSLARAGADVTVETDEVSFTTDPTSGERTVDPGLVAIVKWNEAAINFPGYVNRVASVHSLNTEMHEELLREALRKLSMTMDLGSNCTRAIRELVKSQRLDDVGACPSPARATRVPELNLVSQVSVSPIAWRSNVIGVWAPNPVRRVACVRASNELGCVASGRGAAFGTKGCTPAPSRSIAADLAKRLVTALTLARVDVTAGSVPAAVIVGEIVTGSRRCAAVARGAGNQAPVVTARDLVNGRSGPVRLRRLAPRRALGTVTILTRSNQCTHVR